MVGWKSSPDFENPADAGSDNTYNLEVKATEAGNANTATRSVVVTVSNVVETTPSITSGSSASFSENATGAVYTVRASASDGDGSISFSISGGDDSAKFSINSSSGVVGWKSSPDHETPTDAGSDNVYNLEVKATEAGNTHTVTQTVAITVTDVGDVAPVFTSGSSATFAENGTGAVYTAQVTTDVTGAAVSYSIGGGDSAQFSINSSSGVVSFVSVPDFEIPADADSNNSYQFVVSATEAGSTFVVTRSVVVTVSNVVGNYAQHHQRRQRVVCRERHGPVYTVRASASDSDGSITYSISGGTDSAQFSINSSSGVVGFQEQPRL